MSVRSQRDWQAVFDLKEIERRQREIERLQERANLDLGRQLTIAFFLGGLLGFLSGLLIGIAL